MKLNVEVIEVDGVQLNILILRSFYQIYKYDYQKDSSVIARPIWANQRYVCKNIVWLNEELGEIGFVGISACRILKLSEIKYLEVTNTLPAKGPGSTELVAILNSDDKFINKKEIYFEYGGYFDYLEVEMIRKFTNLGIMVNRDSYDC